MQRLKPLVQNHELYTAEDCEVWQTLFERQMNLLKDNASKLYLDALGQIGFLATEIPNFNIVNERMSSLTGWRLTVVPELVPQQAFFELLAQKIFPATCWLRTFEEIDYIEEPDMFHDVFGHAPLLVNDDYAAFMQGFGKLALKWLHIPEAIELLGRIYWFTIEFGMITENGNNKAFGAGIMSSPNEIVHATSPGAAKRPFNIAEMLGSFYRTDILQEKYFLIDSFQHLCHCLPEIEICINKAVTVKECITDNGTAGINPDIYKVLKISGLDNVKTCWE